jgi:hypothetical protein
LLGTQAMANCGLGFGRRADLSARRALMRTPCTRAPLTDSKPAGSAGPAGGRAARAGRVWSPVFDNINPARSRWSPTTAIAQHIPGRFDGWALIALVITEALRRTELIAYKAIRAAHGEPG